MGHECLIVTWYIPNQRMVVFVLDRDNNLLSIRSYTPKLPFSTECWWIITRLRATLIIRASARALLRLRERMRPVEHCECVRDRHGSSSLLVPDSQQTSNLIVSGEMRVPQLKWWKAAGRLTYHFKVFFSFPFLPFLTALIFFNNCKLVLYLRGGPRVYQFVTVMRHPR